MERLRPPEADFLMDVHVKIGEPIGAGTGTITAGELTIEQATTTTNNARDRLVTIDSQTPSCCIDGRCARCTLRSPEVVVRLQPRPSVAGGGNVTAYAATEWAGYFGAHDDRLSNEKLADIDTKLRSQGLNSGSHCDETAVTNNFTDTQNVAQSKTGCGAADRFKEIIKVPYEMADGVENFVAQLMGDAFNKEVLASRTPKEEMSERTTYWDSRFNLELTAELSDGENVEVLKGSHAELLVMFNFIENTTIDRDALVNETGDQVFVVDMWYIDKLAKGLAAGRPDAEEMYSKLKHHMVAYQIATYLTLCDGSQRPAILSHADAFLAA